MLKNKDGPGMVPHHVLPLILGLLFCAGGFGTNGTVCAQETPGGNTPSERSTIYDLPSGGGNLPTEDDDITEVIQIFGTEIFADSLYLCLEHTEWMKGERAEVISAELGNLISLLSSRARFGSVVFNQSIQPFRNTPVLATFNHKTQMKIWESSKEYEDGASMADAIKETLKIAHLDTTKHRAVVLILDDRYSIDENSIDPFLIATAQNTEGLPIHIFFITGEVSDGTLETSCRLISSSTGGRFRRIPITPDPGQPLLPPLPIPPPMSSPT